jgi:hypothetical protein
MRFWYRGFPVTLIKPGVTRANLLAVSAENLPRLKNGHNWGNAAPKLFSILSGDARKSIAEKYMCIIIFIYCNILEE